MQTLDRLYIGGEWRQSCGDSRTLVAPATELPFASARDGTAHDVDGAVSAARRAALGWADNAPQERAALVSAIGLLLGEQVEALAHDFALEIGTPLSDSRRLQVELGLRVFAQAPALAEHLAAIEQLGNTQVRRVPVGVAACITPWNYPLYQIATKIVPALVAGTPVVLKPSELAPLSVYALARCAERAGLPPGVLNIVFGAAEIGRQLVGHPGIDVVSFTGSTATGRQVGAAAGSALKKVALELGGKSAAVVLADADLRSAVRQTLAKCLQNAGQTCAAFSRLLVSRSQLDEACELAAAEVATYRMGDPMDPSTRLGPVISVHQRERIVRMIRRAIEEGATVIAGGPERPLDCPRGYYVNPTVLVVEKSDTEIVQEEVFGPVLVIQPYEDEEEAVALANGTPFGLSGSVWSADPTHASAIAKRLRAGSVSINGAPTNPEAPFGGFGASGFGRERGRYGLETYSTTQALHR
jgi:acyl-CoA reductase-like NAD-dependent aldehyde dehydrogenase